MKGSTCACYKLLALSITTRTARTGERTRWLRARWLGPHLSAKLRPTFHSCERWHKTSQNLKSYELSSKTLHFWASPWALQIFKMGCRPSKFQFFVHQNFSNFVPRAAWAVVMLFPSRALNVAGMVEIWRPQFSSFNIKLSEVGAKRSSNKRGREMTKHHLIDNSFPWKTNKMLQSLQKLVQWYASEKRRDPLSIPP